VTTVADRRVFVDTNVLVYANQGLAAFHERALRGLAALAGAGAELWVSRQILREYLSAVTRPHGRGPALPVPLAVQRVRAFSTTFLVAEDGPAVTERLLDLVERFPTGGRQVHDANIVATMLIEGVSRLLTFNTADFRRFSPLIAIEPL
jgi:predicted nucleic acid-binding protein